MAEKEQEDKIKSGIHLQSGEVLGPGQEDELRDALGEDESIEDVDAELQRLADEGVIEGFGTTAPAAEGEEGESTRARRSPRKAAKKAAKKTAAKTAKKEG